MNKQPNPRNWTVDGAPVGVDNDEDLVHALHEVAVILSRIGGAVVIAADREQISPDHWHTNGYIFRWTSFAPARRIEPEAAAEPEADPVAAAA